MHSKGKNQENEKNQPIKWEKIFTNYVSDKALVSKIYKKLIQLNSKTTTKTLRKIRPKPTKY